MGPGSTSKAGGGLVWELPGYAISASIWHVWSKVSFASLYNEALKLHLVS